MRKDTIFTIATVLLALCASVLTGLNVAGYREHRSRAPDQPWYYVPNWAEYASVGHRSGTSGAPVTLVMFTDYQCGACRRLAAALDTIRIRHPSLFLTVVRHYPLEGHTFARAAAEAVECASEQKAFQPFHELLLEKIDSIGAIQWTSLAVRAGIRDTVRFKECLPSASARKAVDDDVAAAKKLGVIGTPTILVDNEQYGGTPRGLEQIILRHAAQKGSQSGRR